MDADIQIPLSPIDKIAQGIVAMLKERLPSAYLIELFPDQPDSYDLDNLDRAVLVQYSGSTWSTRGTSSHDPQGRRPEYALHLYVRGDGQRPRTTSEIDKVACAVQGYRLEGTSLRVVRDGLSDVTDGLWHYVIVVACDLLAVAHRAPRPAPLIQTFEKEGP